MNAQVERQELYEEIDGIMQTAKEKENEPLSRSQPAVGNKHQFSAYDDYNNARGLKQATQDVNTNVNISLTEKASSSSNKSSSTNKNSIANTHAHNNCGSTISKNINTLANLWLCMVFIIAIVLNSMIFASPTHIMAKQFYSESFNFDSDTSDTSDTWDTSDDSFSFSIRMFYTPTFLKWGFDYGDSAISDAMSDIFAVIHYSTMCNINEIYNSDELKLFCDLDTKGTVYSVCMGFSLAFLIISLLSYIHFHMKLNQLFGNKNNGYKQNGKIFCIFAFIFSLIFPLCLGSTIFWLYNNSIYYKSVIFSSDYFDFKAEIGSSIFLAFSLCIIWIIIAVSLFKINGKELYFDRCANCNNETNFDPKQTRINSSTMSSTSVAMTSVAYSQTGVSVGNDTESKISSQAY